MLQPNKHGLIWIDDLTGGLNTTDPPHLIGDTQVQTAVNVEWVETRFAQRRQGGANVISTSLQPWGAGQSLRALMKHTPTEETAELWAIDDSATPVLGRLAAGVSFAAVTVGDAFTLNSVARANGVSFNGKFWIAADTAVDRLHVSDGSNLRRAGLATPAVPTVADTGAGAYPAVKRWYKVQWGNDTVSPRVRSELSDAVTFTPSGAGTAARVTRPALPGESETFWNLYGSPDGVNYYLLGSALVATTFIDDAAAPATYPVAVPAFAGFPTAPGYFTAPPSARYLVVDGARMLLASSWEVAAHASRVWWTSIVGTTPAAFLVADDERVPPDQYLDLNPSEGGGITGMAMYQGTPIVFKASRIYKLVATGQAAKPYVPVDVSRKLGALSHTSLVVGEDDQGNECLYFLSRLGPARLGPSGIEMIGRDIARTWRTVNFSPTTPPFGVWHEEKGQIMWWLTTTGATRPNLVIILHVKFARRTDEGVRGGWSSAGDGIADAYAAVMFARAPAAAMSLDLKPYVAQRWQGTLPNGPCFQYDANTVQTDYGAQATAYTASLKTKALPVAGYGTRGGVQDVYVILVPSVQLGDLNVTLTRDFGAEPRTGVVSIPNTSATRVQIPCENVGMADADFVELQIDDATSVASRPWTIDAVGLRTRVEAHR